MSAPLKYRLLDFRDERWMDVVERQPSATVFHHPGWLKLLSECYGFQCFIFALTRGREEILGGIPIAKVVSPLTGRRWVSLPFTDRCQPLFHGSDLREELYEHLKEWQRKEALAPVELRYAAASNGNACGARVWHRLAMSSNSDSIFAKLKAGVRRGIAKARRGGVRIRFSRSREDLEEFYRLHLATRKRLGVPIQPKRFFHLLFDLLIARELAFVALAFLNGRPIAAAVFVNYRNTLIYKYGASDNRFWEYRPNNLLFWEAIEWGCRNGYKLFDWGRTDLVDEGLRRFKRGWGSEEVPLPYTFFPDRGLRPRLRDSAWMGSLVRSTIRRSPFWVCRLAGELLYRHSA